MSYVLKSVPTIRLAVMFGLSTIDLSPFCFLLNDLKEIIDPIDYVACSQRGLMAK